MGILDSIVEWIATQVMNLLDMITGSVLGALGCDMTIFLRYFPAAETMYEVFVAFAIGFILLNLVWQLFRNFGAGIGLSAEDPVKLVIRSVLFIFPAYFSADILELVLDIAGTPYSWDTDVISGMESGMSTVLVLSGVSTRETLRTYAYRPSIVLDGVGDIAAMARAEKK